VLAGAVTIILDGTPTRAVAGDVVHGGAGRAAEIQTMVLLWYHGAVAINLRLREDLHERAAKAAEAEHRSLNSLICDAVAEYLERRDHVRRVDAAADKMLPRYADTLRRLGE
jgi:hypothetical protein